MLNRSRRMPAGRDERAVEAPAMLIVLPVLCVLIFALLDMGVMIRTRILVENIARDAARSAAADGGNYNPRTNTIGQEWDDYALKQLWKNGKCMQGRCAAGKKPTVNCRKITSAGTVSVYYANTAKKAGDLITCTVYYPYKPINGALLNGPLGLGFGSMFEEFNLTQTARAETGDVGAFG